LASKRTGVLPQDWLFSKIEMLTSKGLSLPCLGGQAEKAPRRLASPKGSVDFSE
jgi:hypothetical protein